MTILSQMTVGEIADVVGTQVAAKWHSMPMGRISTDSRSIERGDFFLALKGENFDGHKFIDAAIERGAGGLIIVGEPKADAVEKLPVLAVSDTLYAYGEIARHIRYSSDAKVLAISGSVGKTTTRRIMASSLSAHLRTLEPEKNFNNLIGVPQTLLKLESNHEVVVLELGMNMPGELARLAHIAAPDVAGLTRIGMTHVGMFESLDELIEAKLALFVWTEDENPLVVNAACNNSARAIPRFSRNHPIRTFRSDGREDADFAVINVRSISDSVGYEFDLKHPGGTISNLQLRHFGRHHLEDVACAAAMLVEGGYDIQWIEDGIKNFRSERYRGEIRKVGDWTFILDCYNAAPDSMRASLESLAELERSPEGRLLVVLADMLELGDYSRKAHEDLLPRLRTLGFASFFGLGSESSRLADCLRAEGHDAYGSSERDVIIRHLREQLRPGDTVFFKGSHGFALEKVAHQLAPEAGLIDTAH